MNAIRHLRALGQSAWLDYVDHQLVTTGELDRMIREDGITGLTSNPTIFEKSIAGSSDYDDLIEAAAPGDLEAAIFERICVRDIQLACDALRHVYDETRGADGFASIEVSPGAAHDTGRSIEEARRLWGEVARPNVMVKIPGTREGIRAIEQSLASGINVNVTLLFSVERYVEIAEAYLRALEARKGAGLALGVASVASFFVSRIDAKLDQKLPDALCGRAAIANAKLAFEAFEHIFSGPRWEALAKAGARPQRLLWASTTPKSARYPDIYYVEALAGPLSVDTMAKATLRAYLRAGNPESRIGLDRRGAHAFIDGLPDFARTLAELEDEGVRAFAKSFTQALATIAKKRKALGVAAPDIGGENAPKETEFGDKASARSATGRGAASLKQIP
ncbi:MAG TPA: transaldolase [Polyangiaceae bacterium]|jgi:transaldolase